MAKAMSPPFRGEVDHFYDPAYTAEITARMQVPKRIKINGPADDDDENPSPPPPLHQDKIDMRVPDRILVAGQDQHIGTQAPPLELEVENTIMPPDPGLIRVQTPPRTIKLEEHYFPSVTDDYYGNQNREPADGVSASLNHNNNSNNRFEFEFENKDGIIASSSGVRYVRKSPAANQSDYFLDTSLDSTQLSSAEEVVNLKKQLVKLNRRVMNVEREMSSLNHRQKILISFTAVYFVVKFLSWMSRNP